MPAKVIPLIEKTTQEYNDVIATCKALFEKKTRDYGTAWRILRLPSITDQIFIKAQRIRSIQEKGKQRVDDPIKDEFIGIINYCIIALVQMQLHEFNIVGDDIRGTGTFYMTRFKGNFGLASE